MFTIQVRSEFAAAHRLRDVEGPCARHHGHNYRVEAVIAANALDAHRRVMDVQELRALVDGVVDRVDHRDLNDLPPFDEINPTAEAVAAWLYRELHTALAAAAPEHVRLDRVRLWETPDVCVTYREGSPDAPNPPAA